MNISSMLKICHLRLLGLSLLTFGLVACNSSHNDPTDVTLTYDFNFPDAVYNNQGYWADVYNTGEKYKEFMVSAADGYAVASFSHSASADEYDGVVYHSYTGFCPSRVEDTRDHTPDGWVDYQWAAMGRGENANGYLIAHWDVNETETNHSCKIEFSHIVVPMAIKVANTAWGYWAMKNGSAFSRPFGPDDRCTLSIHGVKGGVEVGQVDVELAADGDILDTWKNVSLTSIGECTGLYFTMTSTDMSEWGMNNPAYFAINNLSVTYLSK